VTRIERARAVATGAAAALCVAVAGALATDIGPWYRALAKPAWTPPDWLFGPAWTIIYALTAAAGIQAWIAATQPGQRPRLVGLFAANGILNVLWSVVFFGLRRPDWAAIEVVALWLSILVLLVYCGHLDRRAGWLLLPYLAWVTFAAALTFEVSRLNAPFDASTGS
jgi:tryptophan-rich sensory protein